ncbi:MAG: MSP porin [Treponema phagedenis]|uniref:major outer sheath protein Msp n=1 Tax=Treponema phagedenis TaxID=162 RepID=UPI00313420DF
MKKYLLVSLTVLFAAAFLWADDAVVQLPEPKVDIEGKGTVEWGIDFGVGKGGTAKDRKVQHGFKNSASWKVKFPLIKKGDIKSSKADVPVYGEVILKDVELNIQSKHDKDDKKFVFDGKVDKLEAKFVFYGAYLTVHGAPSFKTNFADLWKPIENEDFDADSHGFKFEPGFKGAGFKLGYANKSLMDLDLGLKFGSNGAWDAEDKDERDFIENKYVGDADVKVPEGQIWFRYGSNAAYLEKITVPKFSYYAAFKANTKDAEHSKYGIGFDFAMKPLGDMLGFKFGVNSTFGAAKTHTDKSGKEIIGYGEDATGAHDAESVAFSFGAEVTSKPIDGLSLKLGFDGGSKFALASRDYPAGHPLNRVTFANTNKKPGFAWDLLFSTTYKWVGGGVYVASAGTPYHGKNFSGGDDPSKWSDNTADMGVYLKFETKGSKKDDGKLEDSYLVEGLDAGVYLALYRLLTRPLDDTATIRNILLYAPPGPQKPFGLIGNMKGYTQLPMLLKVWASYKANLTDSMWIKPFVNVWAETNHVKRNDGKAPEKPYVGVAYDLGVTYSPVEKVEITAKWAHGKIDNNKYAGGTKGMVIKENANYNNHNGTFTLGVTVKY